MKINLQTRIMLALSAIIIYTTQAVRASDFSCINHVIGQTITPPDGNKARTEQLRKEIATTLIHELGVSKTEADTFISTARYYTPNGKDINKIAFINSKLVELRYLESIQTSK